MPMVEQGRFQSVVQGEGCWFDVWLASGDVVGEGCGEGGELFVGERRLCACCATVFSGWLEVIWLMIYFSLCHWWGRCLLVGVGCVPTFE